MTALAPAGKEERARPKAGRESSSLWLLLPLIPIAWLLSPMAGAQFGIIDDHEIIAILGTDRWLPPWEIPGSFVTWGLHFDGRFRPGYYLLRVIESAMWGDHVLLWYIARLALAGATVAGIIALARQLPWPALVALAVIPFAGPQAESFYRLGPQEAYALPLLVWGLVLVRRWPGVALLLAAGLVKESFAVVLPLIAAWSWWRDKWTPKVIVLALGAFLLCAVVALIEAGGDYYVQVRTVESVWTVAQLMVMPLAICLLPAAVGLFYAPQRLSLALAGAAVAVASQAVVYGGVAEILRGRYLAVVSVAVLITALVGFRSIPARLVPLTAVPLLIFGLATMWVQQDRAESWAASSRAFQQSLAVIAAHPGPLIVTGDERFPEEAVSVRRYLAGPRTSGACAEVVFVEGGETGICPIVYVVRSGDVTTASGPTTYNPPAPVTFKQGTHTGYMFSSSGVVTAIKTYTLPNNSGMRTTKRQRITNQPGMWLAISSGVWAGYFVRESNVAYPTAIPVILPSTPDATFSPAQRLSFKKGTHTGYKFDASGVMTAQKTFTLSGNSAALATARLSTISKQTGTWFLVSSGVWAGYWVRASDIVQL